MQSWVGTLLPMVDQSGPTSVPSVATTADTANRSIEMHRLAVQSSLVVLFVSEKKLMLLCTQSLSYVVITLLVPTMVTHSLMVRDLLAMIVCCRALIRFVLFSGIFVDYVEPLKAAYRERRFQIRDFSYDATKAGSLPAQIKAATAEVKQVHSTIVRWCKAHFGESLVAWVHLKLIRAFVESVLRYGLPVDFVSVFLEPNMKKEKQCKLDLISGMSKLRPELVSKRFLAMAAEEEEEENDDNLPFVLIKIPLIGSGQST